jgi:hypothetical protein
LAESISTQNYWNIDRISLISGPTPTRTQTANDRYTFAGRRGSHYAATAKHGGDLWGCCLLDVTAPDELFDDEAAEAVNHKEDRPAPQAGFRSQQP